jgi:hypothetical protein
MTGKHKPTPPARREAVLRHQAEQLLKDAAAWGYDVRVDTHGGPDEPYIIELTPRYAQDANPAANDARPQTATPRTP